jgi:RNA polymerase sigma factor (sigma-70 family)
MERRPAPDPDKTPETGRSSDVTDLLARIDAGGDRARAELVGRCVAQLRNFAARRMPVALRGAEVDDLVSDTLLSVLRRLERPPVENEAALNALLREALLNRFRDLMRAASRRPGVADSAGSFDAVTEVEQTIGLETSERYEEALRTLTPRDREAVVSRVELHQSYADLAVALNTPTPDAARVLVHRALLKLARAISLHESRPTSSDDVPPGRSLHESLATEGLPRGRFEPGVDPPARALALLASTDWPVRAWITSCPDPWVAGEVSRRSVGADPWQSLVAAGLLARLVRPGSPDQARATIERTLRKEPVAWSAEPRRWARSQSPPVLDAIESIATHHIDRLLHSLASYEPERLDEAEWRRQWLPLAHARDDIEGIVVLLAEAGRGAALRMALEELDSLGRALRFDVPSDFTLEDERLARVSLADPTAWWGRTFDSLTFR